MACASPDYEDYEICSEHQALLTVFCLDDLQPLCQDCADEEHEEHRVYPLSEAAADCKGELWSSLNKLKQRMKEFDPDKKVAENYEVFNHNQFMAELAEEQIRKEFEELHQLLQKEETDRMILLKQDKEEKLQEIQEESEFIDELIESLEERIQLTEAEIEAEGEGAQFLLDYHELNKRAGTNLKRSKNSLLLNVGKHLGNLKFSVWNKMKHSALYSPVTLDPRTAGQGLVVPFPLISTFSSIAAFDPDALNGPDHPERFQPYSSVLGTEGFSSGVHCWDIEVGGCDNWTVGVASQSIPRQVQFDACPETGLWCITFRDGRYLALTSPARYLHYTSPDPLEKIHVRLDFDSDTLEFYDIETDTSLFAFRDLPSDQVYPYFETISKSGCLSIVPKEASVSVELEGDIVEDFIEENEIFDSCQTDSKSQGNNKKIKKRVVKKELQTQAPRKIMFSDEYHVSLFKLQKKSTGTCNQIKHG